MFKCLAALDALILDWIPAARSRDVIRLAANTKAKPNTITRTLRPDKCLVVSSLSLGLRLAALATPLAMLPPPE
jgi:hypothetical protein